MVEGRRHRPVFPPDHPFPPRSRRRHPIQCGEKNVRRETRRQTRSRHDRRDLRAGEPVPVAGRRGGGRDRWRARLSQGLRLANMELPVTLSPTMRMRIGSTSKHFACLAYLLLCEDGRAGLDDAVGVHFPEFHPVARRVTIRQLMGHTSGLRDAVTLCMLVHGTGVPTTEREMLAYYETIGDSDFAPETNWSYNNGAYAILSTAIERISGQSLDSFLEERVFRPVGMNDTMMRRWDTSFVPNSATLHMVDAGGGYTRQYMGMEISGMGGMVSSMDDMLRWLRHMDAPVVGSAETWRLMKAPRTLSNGHGTGYGLGLISALYRGVPTIAHSGGVMGGNSQMIKVPGAGLDISIAANRADVNSIDLANRIIDVCVEGLAPVAEAEAEPAGETRTGLFRSSRTGRVVELLAVEDKPFVSVDAAMPFPLKADGDGGFELAPPVDFIILMAGKVAAVPLLQSLKPQLQNIIDGLMMACISAYL
ncbi:MAG: serine hydrolase domain-containing protein, partial [Sphingobium sp.]